MSTPKLKLHKNIFCGTILEILKGDDKMEKCSECGGKYLDGAEECPHCGYIFDWRKRIELHPICPKCGSQDIIFQIVQDSTRQTGKSEIRKKSPVTRAANSVGRATMIAATGGLWALTPKKSKYEEVHNYQTTVSNSTYGVCQSCGNTWLKR